MIGRFYAHHSGYLMPLILLVLAFRGSMPKLVDLREASSGSWC
jgi:hypothetical protein